MTGTDSRPVREKKPKTVYDPDTGDAVLLTWDDVVHDRTDTSTEKMNISKIPNIPKMDDADAGVPTKVIGTATIKSVGATASVSRGRAKPRKKGFGDIPVAATSGKGRKKRKVTKSASSTKTKDATAGKAKVVKGSSSENPSGGQASSSVTSSVSPKITPTSM